MRYLGVYIVSSRLFSVHLLKQSFYRGANAIFGKIGRLTSEEVVLQLITRSSATAEKQRVSCPHEGGRPSSPFPLPVSYTHLTLPTNREV